jgi:hypothetical protein
MTQPPWASNWIAASAKGAIGYNGGPARDSTVRRRTSLGMSFKGVEKLT